MSVPRPLRPTLTLALLLSSVLAASAADVPGIDNFYKVSDTLYRGAQPPDDAYDDLANLGVKTVLDLRGTWEHDTKDEAAKVEAAGMRYVNVGMNGFKIPNADQLARVRAVMDTGGVVFVHCKRGKDRTGTIVAVHRIDSGWTNQKAYAEAKDCGIQWFSRGMKRLIKTYQPAPAVASADGAAGTPAVVLSAMPDSSAAAEMVGAQEPSR